MTQQPRTEAGQQLLADFRDEEGDYLAPWQVRGMILAIEAEAVISSELRRWDADLAAAPDPVASLPDDDFRDAHERAMRDHILDKTKGWPHKRIRGDIEGCDDLCSDDIVDRLPVASPPTFAVKVMPDGHKAVIVDLVASPAPLDVERGIGPRIGVRLRDAFWRDSQHYDHLHDGPNRGMFTHTTGEWCRYQLIGQNFPCPPPRDGYHVQRRPVSGLLHADAALAERLARALDAAYAETRTGRIRFPSQNNYQIEARRIAMEYARLTASPDPEP